MEAFILPFLSKKSQNAGVIVQERAPDEKIEAHDEGMEACAQDLISAIHSKDASAVAQAIRDLIELADLQPKEDEIEPHSFDAQNIKAGQE